MKRHLVATMCVFAVLAVAPGADAAGPVKYKNCTALNKAYPHGVGVKKGLTNKGGKPVAYKVSKAVYNLNKARDRDKDGIACER